MSLPFTLPPWLPWWVPILVLVPALLYALLFLLMPFSVIGVKGRLDVIEARLDEVQGEIRTLSLRLGEPVRGAYRPDEDAYDNSPLPSRGAAAPPAYSRPPVPPAADPYSYDDRETPRPARAVRAPREREATRPTRAEPRFD
jgi:hypothetical protein